MARGRCQIRNSGAQKCDGAKDTVALVALRQESKALVYHKTNTSISRGRRYQGLVARQSLRLLRSAQMEEPAAGKETLLADKQRTDNPHAINRRKGCKMQSYVSNDAGAVDAGAPVTACILRRSKTLE